MAFSLTKKEKRTFNSRIQIFYLEQSISFTILHSGVLGKEQHDVTKLMKRSDADFNKLGKSLPIFTTSVASILD